MSQVLNLASELAPYIIREASLAGDSLTLPRLLCLSVFVQAWSLALNGPPAFSEPIRCSAGGPILDSVCSKYVRFGSQLRIELPAEGEITGELPEPLRGLILAVLRHYGSQTGLQMREELTAQSVWQHSVTRTAGVVELKNLQAYYKALPPLELSATGPQLQVEFPLPVSGIPDTNTVLADSLARMREENARRAREREDANQSLRTAFAPGGNW